MRATSPCTGSAKSRVRDFLCDDTHILTFVLGLSPNRVKPYKVNDRLIDQAVELKHGKSMKSFNMDRISNSQFTRVSAISQ